jgi:ABC-2 type transport system ATP-binding protein
MAKSHLLQAPAAPSVAKPAEGVASSKVDPVVELRNVTRRFGDVTAVDNVTLTLQPGEATAVLGPNGAGKTTLINLMLGLLRPTSGSARLFGLHPQARAARERIGVMLQVSGVPETLKVRELIWLFRHYYPQPLPPREIVELAGLDGLEDRLYGKLSGGQKQRVHFALAICGDPKLLFLDEPTASLDIELRQAFWHSVERFKARGATVLFTTHHLDEADTYAERIVVIHKGKIRADGPKSEIKARVAGKRVRCKTQLAPERVRAQPFVHEVTQKGGRLEILTDKPEQLIAQLTALDPTLSELEVDAGVLEGVFLELIREEEARS